MILAAESVNFTGPWSTLWGKVNQGTFGDFMTLMTFIGIGVVIIAIGKLVWDKRRGGGNPQPVLWSLLAGALFAAPNALIPIVLKLAEIVVNTIARVIGA